MDRKQHEWWFSVPNDLVGGWSILTVEVARVSDLLVAEGEVSVGDFMNKYIADHIVGLHNAKLLEKR